MVQSVKDTGTGNERCDFNVTSVLIFRDMLLPWKAGRGVENRTSIESLNTAHRWCLKYFQIPYKKNCLTLILIYRGTKKVPDN